MTSIAQTNAYTGAIRPKIDRLSRLDFFDWLMISLSLLAIGSSGYWKVQGPVILISFVAFCIAYVAFGAIVHRIKFRSDLLLAWSVVGVIHLGLSYFRWLPGEPAFYLREYVIRMGYFTLTIYPITAAFYVMFVRVQQSIGLQSLAKIGATSMMAAAIITYLFPAYDGFWFVEGAETDFVSTIGNVLNYSLNGIGIVFWWSVLALVRNSKIGVAVCILVMLISNSAQMNFLALITLVVWVSRDPSKLARPLGLLTIIGFPLSAMLLIVFGSQFGIDPNTLHRAQWWVEALSAVANNGGLALGFGADSTSDFAVDDRFQMLGKWGNLPIHVIHNDFVYSFYAMGIIGGVLFIIFHMKSILPTYHLNKPYTKHAVLMFFIVCLTTSVNSALVSPATSIGLCWAYAYLTMYNRQPQRTRAQV